jgi:hypothetical protein
MVGTRGLRIGVDRRISPQIYSSRCVAEVLEFVAVDWSELSGEKFPAPRTIDQLRDDRDFRRCAADAVADSSAASAPRARPRSRTLSWPVPKPSPLIAPRWRGPGWRHG